MTDEELAKLLRPRHDWIKVVGVLLAGAGIAWGVVKWAATSPTPERVEAIQGHITNVQMEQITIKGDVAGMRKEFSEFKNDTREYQREMTVKIDKLLERRR